jgi:hypothetical protein
LSILPANRVSNTVNTARFSQGSPFDSCQRSARFHYRRSVLLTWRAGRTIKNCNYDRGRVRARSVDVLDCGQGATTADWWISPIQRGGEEEANVDQDARGSLHQLWKGKSRASCEDLERTSHQLGGWGGTISVFSAPAKTNAICFQVLSTVPPEWSLNLIASFLSRSLRRTLHDRYESQILKQLSAGQNIQVLTSHNSALGSSLTSIFRPQNLPSRHSRLQGLSLKKRHQIRVLMVTS